MQHITLSQIEMIPWYTCGLYFAASLLDVKHTRREETLKSRILRYAPMILGVLLLFDNRFHGGVLGMRFAPQLFWLQVVGIALTYLGVAFTIWARGALGANWSPDVTLKVEHELVLSGPYAFVRHPLYTGLTIALIGAVLEIGEWRAILAFAILLATHIIKARQEEKLMAAQFGAQYAEYQKHSGFLIPRLR